MRWRQRLRLIPFLLLPLACVTALALGWWYGLTALVWGAVAGAGLGLALRGVRWLVRAPPLSLLLGTVGGLVGLGMGALLTPALARLPGNLGVFLPLGVSLFLGLIGGWTALTRQGALLEAFPILERLARAPHFTSLYLLDASALTDGRVSGLAATGLLRGALSVPRFVVDDLRRMAESADPSLRARGRWGLEVLNRLRHAHRASLTVLPGDARGEDRSEDRLVALAQRRKAVLVTADSSVARRAHGRGVQVLNISDLADALKPMVRPGEVLQVRIIQEGERPGQGVGFLDDGTMVVVEQGQRYIDQFVDVVVMRTHHTPTGRILFAQPRETTAKEGHA
ncbi:putative PIN and TRAM-domain containing protein YacL [bacterium HR23]|nr:putative PIN and TRAM-domain containing protein YacL [bacterium HR23]